MKEKDFHHLQITQTLSNTLIQHLVNLSQEDPAIREFTRDVERFKDKQTANNYFKKKHVFALIDNDSLYGLIWFGHPKPMPEREYTEDFDRAAYNTDFAIRLYGSAKGKGLALPFMQEAFFRIKDEIDSSKVWLEVKANNEKAIHLYKKFGFKEVTEPDEGNRIVMVQ